MGVRRRRDACVETSTADGDDDRVHVGQILDDLQPDDPGARGDLGLIVGVAEQRTAGGHILLSLSLIHI